MIVHTSLCVPNNIIHLRGAAIQRHYVTVYSAIVLMYKPYTIQTFQLETVKNALFICTMTTEVGSAFVFSRDVPVIRAITIRRDFDFVIVTFTKNIYF